MHSSIDTIGMGACAQNLYENVDVNRFEQIIKSDSVQLVDVRKLDEFKEGHVLKRYS